MSARDSLLRVEAAALTVAGVFRADGTDRYRSTGPCHGGQHSLSVVWIYHPAEGNVRIHCHAGCQYEAVLDAFGLTAADLWDEPRSTTQQGEWRPARPIITVPEPRILPAAPYGWRPLDDPWMPCKHRKIAEYLYADAEGRVAFGVCRCERKCFAQWRPDPTARTGRRWGTRIHDKYGHITAKVADLPYMLPQVIAAVAADRLVWIVEGEKDVRTLTAAGMIATCNAGGAGKWTVAHAAYLECADVRIVADRDDVGRRHALQVIDTLMPLARSIDVVQSDRGKDATDHYEAGGDATDFIVCGEPKPLLLEAR